MKLSKYLIDIQQQLPNKKGCSCNTVYKNTIEALLHEKKQVKIEFNKSWARPQTIKKDEKNRLKIYLGKKYKNFKQFISKGESCC